MNKPYSIINGFNCSSTRLVYCLNTSYQRARTEWRNRKTVSLGRTSVARLHGTSDTRRQIDQRAVRLVLTTPKVCRDAPLGDAPCAIVSSFMLSKRDIVLMKYSSMCSWNNSITSEELRTALGRVNEDAHLKHNLQYVLAERLDEILHRLFGRDVFD